MVNEYSYCPRLAYLKWVQGERVEYVEGTHALRRVGRAGGSLPSADTEDLELALCQVGHTVVGAAYAQQRNRVRGGHFGIDDRTTNRFFKILLSRRG